MEKAAAHSTRTSRLASLPPAALTELRQAARWDAPQPPNNKPSRYAPKKPTAQAWLALEPGTEPRKGTLVADVYVWRNPGMDHT